MRCRLTRSGLLGVAIVALWFTAAACSGGDTSKPTAVGLSTKKLTAGSIEVTVTPRQLDAQGARFDVALDTHSGDLGIDLARSATLEVGGRQWPPARWSGDGPGGHHRSGTLEFPPGGSASGPVRLIISGLPSPVSAEWPR
jgi:hypothetical protein